MPGEIDLLTEIDSKTEGARIANVMTEDLLERAKTLVGAIAANELTYELAGASKLVDEDPATNFDLEDIANDIALERLGLYTAIESAIMQKKLGLRCEHEERVLREQLVLPFNSDVS